MKIISIEGLLSLYEKALREALLAHIKITKSSSNRLLGLKLLVYLLGARVLIILFFCLSNIYGYIKKGCHISPSWFSFGSSIRSNWNIMFFCLSKLLFLKFYVEKLHVNEH